MLKVGCLGLAAFESLLIIASRHRSAHCVEQGSRANNRSTERRASTGVECLQIEPVDVLQIVHDK